MLPLRAASVVPRYAWMFQPVACETGRLRVHAGRGSGVIGLALPLLGFRLLTFVPGVFAPLFFALCLWRSHAVGFHLHELNKRCQRCLHRGPCTLHLHPQLVSPAAMLVGCGLATWRVAERRSLFAWARCSLP